MTDSPDSDASTNVSRRRLLGSAATVGGLVAASTVLPGSVQQALARPLPANGRLKDIKHVVLLMQENRSFDHYFGTLAGVRGFDDPHAAKLPNGKSVLYQPDPDHPDGYLLPYRLNTTNTAAQAIPSTSHAWSVQHSAWNGGKMDNWLPAHRAADGGNGPYTMGYLTREDIPFQYALADAFTICDNYHCSVMGPTHPNRYMWMTGTIDPNGEHGGPALDNNAPAGTYSWTTYPEQLSKAGVSWRAYHQETDVTGWALFNNMAQYQSAKPGEPLYEYGMKPAPIGQFEYDVRNDRLPTVSWLMPRTIYDEHPKRMPAAGATYVAGIIDALARNPEVWAKTVFILSYDENDGLFDHVVPPTPKAGTPDEFVTKTSPAGTEGGGLPIGLGFRVPCVIVSPWTVGGRVCSEVFDHTSQLLFLEKVTGVKATNVSAWRRDTVGDLTSAFRFGGGHRGPGLPETTADYNLAQYEVGQVPLPPAPAGNHRVPHQERGR